MRRLIKTPAGLDAFKARSPLLTQRQRSMFLLCDGRRGVEAVLSETAAVGTSEADVDYLVAQGFLACALEGDVNAIAKEVSPAVAPIQPAAQGQSEERTAYGESWTMF